MIKQQKSQKHGVCNVQVAITDYVTYSSSNAGHLNILTDFVLLVIVYTMEKKDICCRQPSSRKVD